MIPVHSYKRTGNYFILTDMYEIHTDEVQISPLTGKELTQEQINAIMNLTLDAVAMWNNRTSYPHEPERVGRLMNPFLYTITKVLLGDDAA